jgi:VWFA-related protein
MIIAGLKLHAVGFAFLAAGLLPAPFHPAPSLTVGPLTQGSDHPSGKRPRGPEKPVTIPVTIRQTREVKPEQEMTIANLLIREDGEVQTGLSYRTQFDTPLTLAVLVQDDLNSLVGLEIQGIAHFIGQLPNGSRVFVGYIRSGSLEVRQKFTQDLAKAARALRVPIGQPGAAPFNPYVEIREALKRFESQPAGRRAILVLSDGLDLSRGVDSSSPSLSIDLERAVSEAQRRSVAVYSIYEPTVSATARGNPLLVNNAQSSLERLSHDTGGRAFFQGTAAPVSLDPFLRETDELLSKQIALTYLSTHPKKGFHRIEVKSLAPEFEVHYPAGYTR